MGRNSITSWVDVSNAGTASVFFPSATPVAGDGTTQHAPIVLRDTQDYQDFLFVNRRGAVETASALMKEALNISAEAKQYNRVEAPLVQALPVGADDTVGWPSLLGDVERVCG